MAKVLKDITPFLALGEEPVKLPIFVYVQLSPKPLKGTVDWIYMVPLSVSATENQVSIEYFKQADLIKGLPGLCKTVINSLLFFYLFGGDLFRVNNLNHSSLLITKGLLLS